MSLQLCNDVTEIVELCERYNLYLKPLWKVKVCVQSPPLKIPGQSISTWEVMEKLKKMVKPDEFVTLKVSKSNLLLIQLEAEVEKKMTMTRVLQKLQSNSMKLSGFSDVLKIRAAPAKLNFPTRHDWDSFFRDAKNLHEILPGERPDTIYFQNLPSKWFIDKSADSDKPSESVLKRVFETFGDIRNVEIPSIHSSVTGNETFKKISTFDQGLMFDAYVQYKEYMGFVKAMDSLKGMKLVFINDGGKAYSSAIKVDFDRTRYLTEKAILQREKEREKVEAKSAKHTSDNKETTRMSKPRESSAKPKATACDKLSTKASSSDKKLDKSIIRKAKLLRQKEAALLLKELLRRSEVAEVKKQALLREKQIAQERLQQQKLMERVKEEEKKRQEEKVKQRQKLLEEQEMFLRRKLLKDLKMHEQRKTEELREKLRKEIAGRNKLKSVLVSRLETVKKLNKSKGG